MTHQCGSCSDAGCTGLCRGDLTMGEADAYRAGLDDAARALRAMARRIRAAGRDAITDANASTLEIAADALAEIEPRREPDGLSYRGG